MRVLRTIESFYPVMSGPANQAYNISKRLEKKGIKSPILTTNFGSERRKKHEKMDGVEVFRFPIKWKFMKYFYTPDMKKMLKGFDVVHAHNIRSYQTEVAHDIAQREGKPFVVTLHGALMGYRRHLKGIAKLPYIVYDLFIGRKIILNADAIIVNSKVEFKDALDYGIEKKKIHLIPVGINVEDYKPMKKGKGIKVLFVGRISRNRYIEPIIEAAALLKKKGVVKKKGIEFIIVGGEVKSSDTSKSGYLDEMKGLAKELGVSDCVKFAGEKRGAGLRK
ncbi:glycosyltransferase, partial [Nanoarchaeota archaeon]